MKAAVLAVGAAVLALGPGGPVAAQSRDNSFYAGASVGQSTFKNACTGSPGCDDTDTAWGIFGGYQLNPYLAAEIGYRDLGKGSVSGGDLKGKAFDLVGLASYPFTERFSVYGKLGGYTGKLEVPGADETSTHGTYGAGLRYDFTRNVGVRGEWQRYNKMGGGSVVRTDVDVFSVGLLYRFR